MDEPGHITKLLSLATRGDREAEREAARLVYDELHRLAGSRLRGGDRARLQTTELVSEVYLRMFRGKPVEWPIFLTPPPKPSGAFWWTTPGRITRGSVKASGSRWSCTRRCCWCRIGPPSF